MPHALTALDAFTDPVQAVSDGDSVNAAITDQAPQALADRTNFLLNTIHRDQLRNWLDRSAGFNAAASAGASVARRAIYDNGVFPGQQPQILVIGQAGGGNTPPAMLSYTGDSWFDASSGITGTNRADYDGVYCGNGGVAKWCIVGGTSGGGSAIHTHARDLSGGAWTSRAAADNVPWLGISWGEGMTAPLVIVGSTGKINTTVDGITWTSRASGVATDLNGIAFSASLSLYVAAGAAGVLLSSPDGITWTARASGTAVAFVGVVWDQVSAQFVACTTTGVVKRSPDGVTWVAGTAPTDYTTPGLAVTGIATSNFGQIVVWNYQGTPLPAGPVAWVSSDGVLTWSAAFPIMSRNTNVAVSLAYCRRLGWIAAGVGLSAPAVFQTLRSST